MAFYRKRSPIDRLLEKAIPVPESGCWLWVGATKPNGYGTFYFGGTHWNAHRASYKIHVGDIPEGLCVCHKCDTPQCVNPDHLFLGTTGQNQADMRAKGRDRQPDRRGENNIRAKLTVADVALVRASELPTQKLADQFGVTYQTIRNIRHRMSWKEVA